MMDYDQYPLSMKEQLLFYLAGYGTFFIIGYIFYKNLYLSLMAGFLIVCFRNTYEHYLRERRKEKLLMGFKDLLYSLSASVSVGRSMSEALKDGLEHLEKIHEPEEDIILELKTMTDGIYENRENEAVLLNDFAKRSHLEDIEGFTDVYNAVRETGGDVGTVIDRTSQILMDKICIDKEIRTMVSQKKLESGIIACMPIVIIGGMNVTSSSYLQPMYETLEGRIIMTAALAGFAAAYVMILKITDIRI